MIPYLAEMVGTALVFPDAGLQPARRPRNGRLAAAQGHAGGPGGDGRRALAAQSVVLLRRAGSGSSSPRTSTCCGPTASRSTCARRSSPSRPAGRSTPWPTPWTSAQSPRAPAASHPRHVAHWTSSRRSRSRLPGPRRSSLTVPGPTSVSPWTRWGSPRAAARACTGDRSPFLDRIQELHFAADPGRWFGADEGFTVAILGLPAGVPLPAGTGAATAGDRTPAVAVADRVLGRGTVRLTALDLPRRGWRGPVLIELGMAAVGGLGSGTWHPTAEFRRPVHDRTRRRRRAERHVGRDGRARRCPGSPAAHHHPGGHRPVLPGRDPGTGLRPPGRRHRRRRRTCWRRRVSCAASCTSRSRRCRSPVTGCSWSPRTAASTTAGPAPRPATCPRPAAYRRWPRTPRLTTGPGRLAAAPGAGAAGSGHQRPIRPRARACGGPRRRPGPDRGQRRHRDPGRGHGALTFAMQVDPPGGAVYRPFQRLAWPGGDPAGGHLGGAGRGRPAGIRRRGSRRVRPGGRRPRTAGWIVRPGRAVRVQSDGASLCPGRGGLDR